MIRQVYNNFSLINSFIIQKVNSFYKLIHIKNLIEIYYIKFVQYYIIMLVIIHTIYYLPLLYNYN